MLSMIQNQDADILLFIQNNIRSDIMTPIMILLGKAVAVWFVLAAVLLIPRKTRKAGIAAVLALLFSLLVNNMFLKPLVGRIRPYEAVPALTCLIARLSDASFPSAHTAFSFAGATALSGFLDRKYCVWMYLLATLTGLSRLYVGVHYPSDVLVGACSGLVLGLIAVFIVKRMENGTLLR